MEERYSRLEITPKLIDLGSRVVQMKLVATAGIGTVYPWRFLGWPLFLIGALVAVGGYMSLQSFYNPLTRQAENSGGGAMLVGVLILLVAAGAYFYSKRLLVISLAGTEKIVLEEAAEAFLDTIVARIREAMVAQVDAPIHYTVNVTAETIENKSLVDLSTTVDNSRTTVSNSSGVVMGSPGAVAVGGGNSGSIATNANSNVSAAPLNGRGAPNGSYPDGAGFGAGGINGSGGSYLGEGLAAAVRNVAAAASPVFVQSGAGGVSMGGGMQGSSILTQVSVGSDLALMIDLVDRSGMQERGQIIEYLRVLQQYAAASPTPTPEGRSNWLTFFDYASKALTGIDGFAAVAERVHSWFIRG